MHAYIHTYIHTYIVMMMITRPTLVVVHVLFFFSISATFMATYHIPVNADIIAPPPSLPPSFLFLLLYCCYVVFSSVCASSPWFSGVFVVVLAVVCPPLLVNVRPFQGFQPFRSGHSGYSAHCSAIVKVVFLTFQCLYHRCRFSCYSASVIGSSCWPTAFRQFVRR